MVMGVYLQDPSSGFSYFPASSVGKIPLEFKYTYRSALGHVVSKYIWLWWSNSKTIGVVALFFPAPSGGTRLLEMKYTYQRTLGHVVSEYIWLWSESPKS